MITLTGAVFTELIADVDRLRDFPKASDAGNDHRRLRPVAREIAARTVRVTIIGSCALSAIRRSHPRSI